MIVTCQDFRPSWFASTNFYKNITLLLYLKRSGQATSMLPGIMPNRSCGLMPGATIIVLSALLHLAIIPSEMTHALAHGAECQANDEKYQQQDKNK